MIKSYKVRIYPNTKQEAILFEHINCSRFLWNYMLEVQNKRYENHESHLNVTKLCSLLTTLKHTDEYNWLNNVSVTTLQKTCNDLSIAFDRYFKKISNKPKYKSKKKSNKSFPISNDRTYFDDNGYVKIPKAGKIKYKSNYKISFDKELKLFNPRIKYVNQKWIISFGLECDNQTYKHKGTMGIDLGIKDLAVVSFNGEKIVFSNINKSNKIKNMNNKIKYLQKKISRKYKINNHVKTNRIIKIENQIKDIYYHLTNIRKDYIHKTTAFLTNLLPKTIVMEDLDVLDMLKDKHLTPFILQQEFGEFRRQMEYKCKIKDIELVFADRYYPSSKTCSCCGKIKKNLKLSDRKYVCNYCGNVIDRDFNAALNLERYINQ